MYEIGWEEDAIDGLATLSLLHPGRWAEINAAVDLIEFRLERFPMTFANEVSEGLWRINVPPVGISFTIAGKDITIESIGWIGYRNHFISSTESVRLIVKAIRRAPQAERGISDVIHFFAVGQAVPAIAQPVRIIAAHQRC